LGTEGSFNHYQNDPVAFGEDILEEIYTDEVKAVMRSVRDNVVTVAQSANAIGKSHCAARIAVWWYKCQPNPQVYLAAAPPEANLRRILWAQVQDITEKHPKMFQNDTISNLNINRSALSFISGVTIPTSGSEAVRESRFSGKHAESLLFLADEGDAIPDEVYRGIESCMTGGHARLLIMFNPRAEVGAAYRMIRDGRANVIKLSAFSHPNVIEGKEVILGAVTRQTTVRRINQWCRPLVEGEPEGEDCFKLPEFLEGAIAVSQGGQEYPPLRPGFYKIKEPAFSYMALGEYPAQGSTQLISKEWINNARSRWDSYVSENGERPPAGTSAVLGLDIGEFGSDSTCACFRYGGFVERLIGWGGVDTIVTGDRASDEYKKRKVLRANVDATGVGSGVAPQMQRNGCFATGVKVASRSIVKTELGEFQILRDQLWWACREWLRTDPGAMLPPDEWLNEELGAPTYQVEKGKIRVMKKQTMREVLKRSPDRADSLCLTFYEPDLLFPKL